MNRLRIIRKSEVAHLVSSPAIDCDSLTIPFSIAFPFVISPEDALRRMGPYFTFHKDQYTGKWSDSLKALGAQALPFFFDWTPPQPERMQAVYLPVWFMDAEVQARIHDGDDTVS